MGLNGLSKSQVLINGKSYRGDSVEIDTNGNVFVDGKKSDQLTSFNVEVKVEGNVKEAKLHNGNLTCNDIGLSATSTNGDITCRDVRKVSTTNGNVKAHTISGSVTTVTGNVKSTHGDIIRL